jgi:glycosyltransferase involved in cell wall biosynthesis
MYNFSINSTHDLRVNNTYGYGKSLIEIKKSIRQASFGGRKIMLENNSPRSPVQMYYGPHPFCNSHHPNQYKIHMSQTESYRYEQHKVEVYKNSDEFWTASEWGKEAAIRSGIPSNKVFVYHHGIFPVDYPVHRRGNREKIRFLHIDSGSPRKRSDIVEKAFDCLFSDRQNLELTLKYSYGHRSSVNWYDPKVMAGHGTWVRPGVRHIYENLSQKELVALMHFHDVLVYPSEGEGFGLIPLEALATGMPTISTHEWAPYSQFFSEGWLTSTLQESSINWGYSKEGECTITTVEETANKMQYFIDNLDQLSENFLVRSESVKQAFDWNSITTSFFEGAIERLGDVMLMRKALR